ncbi:MAG: glycoside hydrolase family 127 protein [Clostridia bacterium]|nr:glycoside hydrolase family 127 protein [Clostridia bacterium]
MDTLAAYFINERGKHPDEAQKGIEDKQIGEGRGTVREYYNWASQSDIPVRECGTAHGHAVRAGYLYTAMAALARQTNDDELRGACARLFRDIVDTKLSITGGVGAQVYGEAFGPAYRLPNRENYNETCAAIALVMFASELQKESARKEYADVIERVLYNGMISGLSLDGDAFFYENALEIDLRDYDYSTRIFRSNISAGEAHNYGLLHERRLKRAKVFSCSCCPPNITRMLATVAGHMYSVDGDVIYCHQFASSEATLNVKGEEARLTLRTDYPNDGKLTYTYFGPKAVLAVRIPDWCVEYAGETQDGYATFSVADGDTVTVTLPMEIHFVEANRMVSETAGKYAVSRGPIVYCMEGRENGGQLWDVVLCEQGEKKVSPSARYGAPTLSIAAYHRPTREALYSLKSNERVAFTAKLIPYFAFANGEEADDMQIWTRVE